MAAAKFLQLQRDARDEAIQNTLALTWQNYVSLIEQGRGGEANIIKSILWFSIKQTKAHRSLSRSGNTNAKDVGNAANAGMVHFERADLRQYESSTSSIPDIVAFRIDVPEFLRTLNDRPRCIAEDLMMGERTKDVADKYGITPGAVSQHRERIAHLFAEFTAS